MINNEEINEVDEMPKIKVEAVVDKQFFPKNNAKVEHGDFAILTWKIKKVLEGEPKTHPWFHSITTLGNVCEIEDGEVYTLLASESSDTSMGTQYDLTYIFKPMDLTSVKDQRTFLSQILTETQVDELFNTFENPIEKIDRGDIEALTTVKGIGESRAESIINKYETTKDYSKIYVELDGYNLTSNMISRLVHRYNSPEVVVDKIKTNPYVLATEVDGIGFRKADEIALNYNMEWNNPKRVEAFILHTLETEGEKGNSYIYANYLMYDIEDALGDISNEVIGEAVSSLVESKRIGIDEIQGRHKRVYLHRYKNLERKVSNELLRILNGRNTFQTNGWQSKVRKLEEKQGWEHTDQQWEGIKTVLENQVVVINGFGGTGKSSVVSAMLEAFNGEGNNYTFAQTALSGRASSKLQEVTGEDGLTIHRLLGFNPYDGFTSNKENPLPHDLIVLDEISLVGGEIFLKLEEAIATGSKLIILGDSGQLESIGCMNLARDLIESRAIPIVTLTEIHRQAKLSGIITCSLQIRNGEQLVDNNFDGISLRGELEDFELDISKDRDTMRERMVEHFQKWYAKVKDIMDIQLIVPVISRGECCVNTLNDDIQKIYNPWNRVQNEYAVITNKVKGEKYILREKDKVMITKNNYKTVNEHGKVTPIFNGWMGIIQEINTDANSIIVYFPIIRQTVIIPTKQAKAIQLGYASTVHKQQGSDCKVVIGGIDYSTPPFMLTRELVYTMVTRAREHCVLVAQNSALRDAIETSNVSEKNTFLREMLDEGIENKTNQT